MTKIVAEIGKNFIYSEQELSITENLNEARELVKAAKTSGATVVKFQCHVFKDERYKRSPERFEWIKRNERATPYEEFWKPLKEYCDELKIEFLCTPMSLGAARKIEPLIEEWKVGSADILDFELLDYMVSTRKHIIISSGMSTRQQLQRAIVHLIGKGTRFSILHCVSIYPCEVNKLNLNTIDYLKHKYPYVQLGFSDHSLDTFAPSLAVAKGAKIIEKHFTLDRQYFGPDHKCSLLPNEFKEMVERIRITESMLGVEDKVILNEERKYWVNFRR